MHRTFLTGRGLPLALGLVACAALLGGCRHNSDADASPAAAPAASSQSAASDPNAPDPRIAGEAEIRALDAELQKAITANDSAKAAAFFDDAATVMVPGQSAAQGGGRRSRGARI